MEAKDIDAFKEARKNLDTSIKNEIAYIQKVTTRSSTDSNPAFKHSGPFYIADLYLMTFDFGMTTENECVLKRLRATINLLLHIFNMLKNTYAFAKNGQSSLNMPMIDLFEIYNPESDIKGDTPIGHVDPKQQASQIQKNSALIQQFLSERIEAGTDLNKHPVEVFNKNFIDDKNSVVTGSVLTAYSRFLENFYIFEDLKAYNGVLNKRDLKSQRSAAYFINYFADLLLASTYQLQELSIPEDEPIPSINDAVIKALAKEDLKTVFLLKNHGIRDFLYKKETPDATLKNRFKVLLGKKIQLRDAVSGLWYFLFPIAVALVIINVILFSFYFTFVSKNKTMSTLSRD